MGIDRLDGLPAEMAGQVGRIGQWRDLVGRGPRRAERQLVMDMTLDKVQRCRAVHPTDYSR